MAGAGAEAEGPSPQNAPERTKADPLRGVAAERVRGRIGRHFQPAEAAQGRSPALCAPPARAPERPSSAWAPPEEPQGQAAPAWGARAGRRHLASRASAAAATPPPPPPLVPLRLLGPAAWLSWHTPAPTRTCHRLKKGTAVSAAHLFAHKLSYCSAELLIRPTRRTSAVSPVRCVGPRQAAVLRREQPRVRRPTPDTPRLTCPTAPCEPETTQAPPRGLCGPGRSV